MTVLVYKCVHRAVEAKIGGIFTAIRLATENYTTPWQLLVIFNTVITQYKTLLNFKQIPFYLTNL